MIYLYLRLKKKLFLDVGSFVSTLLILSSSKDDKIISGSHDGNIIVFRRWKNYTPQFILRGHTGGILTLSILPDGRLISGTQNSEIRIWDLETGNCDLIFPIVHKSMVACIISTENQIISGGGEDDGMIVIWR